MTPGDSFANDNTLRRRVGSLAPVSRFTFCRRSSRLPYRTVVCLPLSPRVGGSPENRRFSKETPSISFSSSSSSFSFWCRISIGEMLKSKVENKCFFSETFLFLRNILPRFTTKPSATSVTKPPVGSHEHSDSCIGRQKQTATEVYTVSRSTDRLTGN